MNKDKYVFAHCMSFTETQLRELFDKTYSNDDKEQ